MSPIAGRPDDQSGASSSPPGLARRVSEFLGLDRRTLAPAIGHGVVVGLAVLVPVVSYPSLVFSGPLQAFSGIGVGLGLLSALVLTIALVIGGSVGGTVGVAQSEPAIVLGVIATSMAIDLRAAGAEDQVLPTVMAAVIISALAVGAVFLLLGTLRAGNLIRFMPYPLIVGFIGGMGWLLLGGAVRVATGLPLAVETSPSAHRARGSHSLDAGALRRCVAVASTASASARAERAVGGPRHRRRLLGGGVGQRNVFCQPRRRRLDAGAGAAVRIVATLAAAYDALGD